MKMATNVRPTGEVSNERRVRTVNHLVHTNTGAVHYASDNMARPAHILGCSGRAVSGLGISIGSIAVTCKACRKAAQTDRIAFAEGVSASALYVDGRHVVREVTA
jgi:hypothetical protein